MKNYEKKLQNEIIGKRLEKLREEYEDIYESENGKRLTDRFFEKKLNITRQTYKKYENGESGINLNVVLTLSKLYDVSSDYILGISDVKYMENDNINKMTGLDDISIKTLSKYKNDTELIKFINFLIANLNFNSDKSLRTKDNYSRESIIRLLQFYFNTSEDSKEFTLVGLEDMETNMNIKKGKMYVNNNFLWETIRKSELSKIKLLELQAELINLKRELNINKKEK